MYVYAYVKKTGNDDNNPLHVAKAASAAVGQQPGEAKLTWPKKQLRILVVEDHLVNQKVAVAMVGFGSIYRVYAYTRVCHGVCTQRILVVDNLLVYC